MTEPITRRRFIAGLVAGVAVAGCGGGSDDGATASSTRRADGQTTIPPTTPATTTLPVTGGPEVPDGLFALGVASGDPLSDSVILWTRLAPEPASGGGMPEVPVPVTWEVARDGAFRHVVARGTATATPALAHSVHIDASGLDPDTWYSYRFRVGDQISPVGRTRTAPAVGSTPDRLRFLFASCQDWQDGYWSAWPHVAAEHVDLVVFLGDYIYENGNEPGSVRPIGTGEARTLQEYRARYGAYKQDAGLRAAQAAAPWIVTWDDHEVEDNYAGATAGEPSEQAAFEARRAAAYQAYYEHQPLRLPAPEPGTTDLRLFRTVDWGHLVRFHVLDGRHDRTDQPCRGTGDVAASCPAREAESATMLGPDQESWLGKQFASSEARWNVIANQVILSAVPLATLFNMDQWDGYPAARQRLIAQLGSTGVANPVVITGDIHAAAVGEVRTDGVAGRPVATELVGTSISSSFPAQLAGVAEALIGSLPDVSWFDVRGHGYTVCDVTSDHIEARYRMVATTTEPASSIATRRTFVVEAGTVGVRET